VKYHFKTDQGVEYFTQDEGDRMASVDTDCHVRDLWEHIEDDLESEPAVEHRQLRQRSFLG
jgi:catalase